MIDPELRDDAPTITPRLLRQFAALWLLIFGALAAIEAFDRHRIGMAVGLALLATGIGVPGLVKPASIRTVFVTVTAFTIPIGWVVSRAALFVIFYLVFTPIALVFRVVGRDALRKRSKRNADTYWHEWQQPSDPRSYLHQS